jgi:hypothetical protein
LKKTFFPQKLTLLIPNRYCCLSIKSIITLVFKKFFVKKLKNMVMTWCESKLIMLCRHIPQLPWYLDCFFMFKELHYSLCICTHVEA